MALISVTKLANLIIENPSMVALPENAPKEAKALAKYLRSHSETYGSKTCCYVPVNDIESRWVAEKFMKGLGHKVNSGWGRGKEPCKAFEITVSYFKAYGWDI